MVDAVRAFVGGDEFRTSLQTFIDSHCALFDDGERETKDHGQHEIWQQYGSWMDRMLEGQLQHLECDANEFYAACEECSGGGAGSGGGSGNGGSAVQDLLRAVLTLVPRIHALGPPAVRGGRSGRHSLARPSLLAWRSSFWILKSTRKSRSSWNAPASGLSCSWVIELGLFVGGTRRELCARAL